MWTKSYQTQGLWGERDLERGKKRVRERRRRREKKGRMRARGEQGLGSIHLREEKEERERGRGRRKNDLEKGGQIRKQGMAMLSTDWVAGGKEVFGTPQREESGEKGIRAHL